MNPCTDYIRAYMPDRPIKPGSTALVMIDLQYATGSRHGAYEDHPFIAPLEELWTSWLMKEVPLKATYNAMLRGKA